MNAKPDPAGPSVLGRMEMGHGRTPSAVPDSTLTWLQAAPQGPGPLLPSGLSGHPWPPSVSASSCHSHTSDLRSFSRERSGHRGPYGLLSSLVRTKGCQGFQSVPDRSFCGSALVPCPHQHWADCDFTGPVTFRSTQGCHRLTGTGGARSNADRAGSSLHLQNKPRRLAHPTLFAPGLGMLGCLVRKLQI